MNDDLIVTFLWMTLYLDLIVTFYEWHMSRSNCDLFMNDDLIVTFLWMTLCLDLILTFLWMTI